MSDFVKDFAGLEELPDAILTDITPPHSAAPSNDGTISDEEIHATGNHAKAENNTFGTGKTDEPKGANSVGATNNGGGASLGGLIGGKFAVDLIDTLLPSLLVLIIHYIGYAAKKSEFQLNAKEKETLAIPFQQYLDTIRIDLNNPFYNLLVSLGIVYGAKIIDKIPNAEKVKKPTKQDTPKENSVTKEIIEQHKKEEQTQTMQQQGTNKSDESLIKATIAKRKKGRAEAINWLKSKGQLQNVVTL